MSSRDHEDRLSGGLSFQGGTLSVLLQRHRMALLGQLVTSTISRTSLLALTACVVFSSTQSNLIIASAAALAALIITAWQLSELQTQRIIFRIEEAIALQAKVNERDAYISSGMDSFRYARPAAYVTQRMEPAIWLLVVYCVLIGAYLTHSLQQ